MPFDTSITITAQARRIDRPHIAAMAPRNTGDDDSSRDHIDIGGDDVGFGFDFGAVVFVGGSVLAGDFVDIFNTSPSPSHSSSGAAIGTAIAMGTLSRSVCERVGSLGLIVLSPCSRSSSVSKARTAIGRMEDCVK